MRTNLRPFAALDADGRLLDAAALRVMAQGGC